MMDNGDIGPGPGPGLLKLICGAGHWNVADMQQRVVCWARRQSRLRSSGRVCGCAV